MRRVGLCITLLLLISAVATAGILENVRERGVLSVQVEPSIAKVGQNVEIEPRMSVSPEEFETDIYQGSKAKFGIVIEETSGLAPLKNVQLRNVEEFACLCLNCICPIPSEWISFDKNNFDVPAGGKVTVNCTIKIPKDAEPGRYVGLIAVDAENDGRAEIKLTVNVLKDTIPPEIVVYSPRDGEVVHRPYVTLDAVVRDNIGIGSIKISVNEEIIPSPATLGPGVEIPIKQEIQLKEGWNCIRIEAEDSAGNWASKTVWVKYEPIITAPTVTITPVECISDEDCTWCGTECVRKRPGLICPAIVPPANCTCTCMAGKCVKLCWPIPPTPPNPGLKRLNVSIYPKYAEARPGDTINYTVTIDWYPPEWKGDMKISAVISAAGFEKRFELPPVSPVSGPPLTTQIPVPIPSTIPPLTYKLKLEVVADSLRASDEAELKVKAVTPGFEVVSGILAGAAALALRRARL